jgi:hypothetical protein
MRATHADRAGPSGLTARNMLLPEDEARAIALQNFERVKAQGATPAELAVFAEAAGLGQICPVCGAPVTRRDRRTCGAAQCVTALKNPGRPHTAESRRRIAAGRSRWWASMSPGERREMMAPALAALAARRADPPPRANFAGLRTRRREADVR